MLVEPNKLTRQGWHNGLLEVGPVDIVLGGRESLLQGEATGRIWIREGNMSSIR